MKKTMEYKRTRIPREKTVIRNFHQRLYREFKRIIAPGFEIHHAWVDGSSEYNGVALVEKDAHRHGYIDVIHILDGEITILKEEKKWL